MPNPFKQPRLLWLLLLIVLGVSRLHAQSAGAILTGQVTDASQATIPAASLVLKNEATGVTRAARTNEAGRYTAADVQPGMYTVTVSAPSFSTSIQHGVELTVGSTRQLDVSLQAGANTERIEVNATPLDVETDTSIVSATVGEKRIQELPLNGRDWTQLATLQPGVSSIRSQQVTTGLSNRGVRGFGNQLASNGHSPYENTYRIDGINENDYSNGAPGDVIGANLGVDAIQEFNVVTSAYTAEFGRTSGAVINAITRSGTNTVHGSAYVFDRDKIFDARNYFDFNGFGNLPVPPFHRVQFGASGGAPIRKDKTFIFANYEGIRQDQSLNYSATVPTASARAGVVDPKIVPFLALYPLPNTNATQNNGTTGTFQTTGLSRFSENFLQTRFDQTFSQKNSLSLTYLYDNGPQLLPDVLGNTLNRLSVTRHVAAITDQTVFSPNLVNVVRLGYNRSTGQILTPVSALNAAAADHTLGYTPSAYAPSINVVGLTLTGGLGNLRQSAAFYNSLQFDNDLSYLRGRHALKIGFAYERFNANSSSKNQNGSATFLSLSDFLANKLAFAILLPTATTNPVEVVDNLFGGYIQDDWHASKSLTVNLGVRYEMLTIPKDRHNRLGLVLNPVAAPGSGPCPVAFGPTSVPGCVVPVNQFWQTNPTTHNFEPRIGFAYSPYADQRTSIRGAFGIYDMLPLPYIYTPFTAVTAPYSQDGIVVGRFVPQGSFPNAIAAIAPAFASLKLGHYIDQHPKRTYSMNYNLNIEQQLSKKVSTTIGYVGFHGVHQPFQAQDYNQTPESATQVIDGRRVYPTAGGTKIDSNGFIIFGLLFDGVERYDSLVTQLKVRDLSGLNAQATYTWNRCTDLGSSVQADSTYQNSLPTQIYYDKQQRKGACDYEVKQNFSANLIYDLPGFKHGLLAAVTKGFQVGTIITASTGVPFTLQQQGDVLGQDGTSYGALPDFTAGCNPYNTNYKSNGLSYINSKCFTFPTVSSSSKIAPLCNQDGTTPINGQTLCVNVQGNERRNSLTGPKLVNADLSIIKNTHLPHLAETTNLQLRVEAFNVLNHTNFQAPTNNFTFGGRGNFNQVAPGSAGLLDSTATSSRQIQLGAKLIF